MVVRHNMVSANTARTLGVVSGNLKKSIEKLSSGYKINRSADDAAGLSISEKMRRQIRGLTQASRNAQDGVSVCQIADGALDESTSIVHRIRELAVKAANDTNTLSERKDMQNEIDELIKEIDRISTTTTFNNIGLLDGTLGDANIPTADEIYDRFAYTGNYATNNIASCLKIDMPLIDPSAVAAKGQANVEKLQSDLINSIVPQCINGLANTFPVLGKAITDGKAGNHIGLKLYDDGSDTLAFVSYKPASYNKQIIDMGMSLQVNVSSLQFDASGNLTASSRKELEATIVHEMMHAFSVDLLTNGMLDARDNVLEDPNGSKFPIWFTEGLAQTASGGMDWTQYSTGLGITPSTSLEGIKSSLTNSNHTIKDGGSVYNGAMTYGTGYLATMYLGYLAAGGGAVTAPNVASGVNKIIGNIMGGKSLDSTIKELSGGKYTGLYDFQGRFGSDNESASFVHELVSAAGIYGYDRSGGRGALIGGDFAKNDLVNDGNASAIAYTPDPSMEYRFSSPANRHTESGGGLTDSAGVTPPAPGPNPPGPNPPVTPTPGPNPPGPNPPVTPTPGPNPPGYATAGVGLNLQVGSESGQSILLSIDRMDAKVLGIDSISVLHTDGIKDTMIRCDYALNKIAETRSEIGATQNRLEHTINNLDNIVENTTAAEAAIRDTDMAKEMFSYSINQILVQSGTAMLAQANKYNDGIMALLSF